MHLRALDHPRYVLTLLAERKKRDDLAALFAFNLTLGAIDDRVSEDLIGRMRLQFWRDALDGIATGNPPAHPVAEALSGLVQRYHLSRGDLSDLIDSHDLSFGGGEILSLSDVLVAAEKRGGSLHRLAATLLQIDDVGGLPEEKAEAAAMAAFKAGTAWALVGLIRSSLFDAGKGRCRLPISLCREYGLDPEAILDDESRKPLASVLAALGEHAEEYLSDAKALNWPRRSAPAVLIGAVAKSHLARLRAVGFDLRDPAIADLVQGHRIGPGAMASLWWQKQRGKL